MSKRKAMFIGPFVLDGEIRVQDSQGNTVCDPDWNADRVTKIGQRRADEVCALLNAGWEAMQKQELREDKP
jgi:hypothetical protein